MTSAKEGSSLRKQAGPAQERSKQTSRKLDTREPAPVNSHFENEGGREDYLSSRLVRLTRQPLQNETGSKGAGFRPQAISDNVGFFLTLGEHKTVGRSNHGVVKVIAI